MNILNIDFHLSLYVVYIFDGVIFFIVYVVLNCECSAFQMIETVLIILKISIMNKCSK